MNQLKTGILGYVATYQFAVHSHGFACYLEQLDLFTGNGLETPLHQIHLVPCIILAYTPAEVVISVDTGRGSKVGK